MNPIRIKKPLSCLLGTLHHVTHPTASFPFLGAVPRNGRHIVSIACGFVLRAATAGKNSR